MGDITAGTIIGGYKILEEVGQGGMATVYRAHQLSMQRDVAVKVLPHQFLRQSNSLDRFKQEANIVARLEHRAIVPVHDYGEYEGVPYLVMRYMDGGSVDDLLNNGPIPPLRTLDILQQIAPALDYAHHNDVLHRDLKPSNILLDANGDAYITDFGIARLLGENSTSLTTTGVVGTPSYMSPEQAQGHALDGRSDVYALGVVVFEMLTGARPFEGETPYSVAVKHVTEAPPSACGKNRDLPYPVDQVLFKALAKTPDQRYQSAGELAEALKMALTQPSVAASALAAQSAESMIETEPSLEQALREGAGRRRVDTSHTVLPNPVPHIDQRSVDMPPLAPNIQVMQPYVEAQSGVYPQPVRQSHARRRSRARRIAGQPRWLVWTVSAFVVGSLVMALLVSGLYFLLNDTLPDAAGESNYPATAIYKMTETKHAILGDGATLDGSTTPGTPVPQITVQPTIPPTNTRHAVTSTPAPTLPLVFPNTSGDAAR